MVQFVPLQYGDSAVLAIRGPRTGHGNRKPMIDISICRACTESPSPDRTWPVLVFLLVPLLLALPSCTDGMDEPMALVRSPGISAGDLVVAVTPKSLEVGEPPVAVNLRTTWTNGRSYQGMEDNDLRGYLDGRFKWGWNQPGQVHVRVGRRGDGAKWGEWELFRILHEWRGIKLPRGTDIVEASLRLTVERPGRSGKEPVTLLLYAVKKPFHPGEGGIERDNVSPPATGEVWWNDVGYGTEAWALPGAGFASDGPRGDTDAQPLAFDSWAPGDSSIVFRSDRLTEYMQHQVDAGEPLRFLIRLSAFDEDTPGTGITIYSGSTGDDWMLGRRPQLSATWSPPLSTRSYRWPVLLEYGATFVTPCLTVEDAAMVGADFEAAQGTVTPSLEVRGGADDSIGPWQPVDAPLEPRWEWLQIRVTAATHPLRFGTTFRAEFKNTWVRTAPPEEQEVPFVFVSPTGATDTVMAEYVGGHTWRADFLPRELGPWRYTWSNSFADDGYRSPSGTIDVVPGELSPLLEALRRFLPEASPPERSEIDRSRAMVQFMRLERAVIERLGPEGFRNPEGFAVRALLDSVRVFLGGRDIPDPLPMVPSPPPAWK